MLRVALLLASIGLTIATPSVVRSREEIEAFRQFLESTKTSDGAHFLARSRANPLANPEENSGHYQGDIILDDWMIEGMLQQYAEGRNAYTWPDTHWPDSTVVWEFADDFTTAQMIAILEGIADIEKQTCVKFRYRRPGDTAYVRITGSSSGCFAHVGYWESRGAHSYNLAFNQPGVGCFRHATIVHEFLHILGFLHMQSTHDRDDYVKIVEENLTPGTENNFQIYSPDLVSNLDIEYEYTSCMHYSAYAFSANGEKTIIALKEHEGDMGQRLYITDKDWLRLNRHYQCHGAWDKSSEEESSSSSEEDKKEDSSSSEEDKNED